MLNIQNSVDRIRELVAENNIESLKTELNGYHSADLADIFPDLDTSERIECFNLIDEEKSVELLEYLPPQLQVEILGDIDAAKASELISKLPHDDAADVLGEFEDDESAEYLEKLPQKFSSEVRELLKYDESTAGGIMTPLVLTVNADMDVEGVLSTIRIKAEKENMDLYYVYVVDNQNHLVGVLSLRDLLTSPIHKNIKDIMQKDIVKLHIDDYQDYIADIFMKYQFSALPVVDMYNHLKGIVTWDDAQDIVEEETTDEIYTSSGIIVDLAGDDEDILSGNIFNSIKARTPWLFITLIGEFIAVTVANHFTGTVDALPVIAVFMPLLAGLGGNIGTQSITLMVRGLSTGQITLRSQIRQIGRESAVGLLIGLFFGFIVAVVTMGWQHNIAFGVIVGVAMALNMMIAAIIGAMTPFILKRLKIDPAVASGPVIATSIDVIGLFVYFSLVTFYLVKIMH